MAKDKIYELNYKIEGLKRMIKRKAKREFNRSIKRIQNAKLKVVDQFLEFDHPHK